MIKKYIFSAAMCLIMHGTIFTMMHSRKIMYRMPRLTLHQRSSCQALPDYNPFYDNASNKILSDELKARKEREDHYAWQVANEVAKIRVKFEILAAKLPADQEKRMFQEANNIMIRKKE